MQFAVASFPPFYPRVVQPQPLFGDDVGYAFAVLSRLLGLSTARLWRLRALGFLSCSGDSGEPCLLFSRWHTQYFTAASHVCNISDQVYPNNPELMRSNAEFAPLRWPHD